MLYFFISYKNIIKKKHTNKHADKTKWENLFIAIALVIIFELISFQNIIAFSLDLYYKIHQQNTTVSPSCCSYTKGVNPGGIHPPRFWGGGCPVQTSPPVFKKEMKKKIQ